MFATKYVSYDGVKEMSELAAVVGMGQTKHSSKNEKVSIDDRIWSGSSLTIS